MNLYQLDPPTTDAYLVWVTPGEQPDYEAAKPEPVVEKCGTCGGSGEAAKIGKPPASHRLLGHTTPCPNPDCVSGWVTNLGTIEWRCNRLGLTGHHPCRVMEDETEQDHADCGLVLVIPIENQP